MPGWLRTALWPCANFSAALIAGQLTLERSVPALAALVQRHTGQDELKRSVQWFGELLFGGLLEEMVVNVVQAAQQQSDYGLDPLQNAVLLLLSRPEAQVQ